LATVRRLLAANRSGEEDEPSLGKAPAA